MLKIHAVRKITKQARESNRDREHKRRQAERAAEIKQWTGRIEAAVVTAAEKGDCEVKLRCKTDWDIVESIMEKFDDFSTNMEEIEDDEESILVTINWE